MEDGLFYEFSTGVRSNLFRMDLEYPSHPNVDILKQLNRLDKLTSKLNLTVKDVPAYELIPPAQRQKIAKLLARDDAPALLAYLARQVISCDKEVGAKLSRWNVLHLACKYDAARSLRALLKTLYQQDPDEYLRVVNLQTAEGFTPLMVSIMQQAHGCLAALVELGGSDLFLIEGRKQRAYDLALAYHNQPAIQQLIVYEHRCKKQMFLNCNQLLAPEPQPRPSWCQTAANYLLDCLLCLNREEAAEGPPGLAQKLGSLLGREEKEQEWAGDAVKIGSRRDIEDYEIEWRRLSGLPGQKSALFDSFRPMDISEHQFSLQHHLIVFQALADFSWVLKRAIKPDDSRHKQLSKTANQQQLQQYAVTLYKNFTATKVVVDESVPVVRDRGEVMFLSNPNEVWPMVLQKALAKVNNSYLQLNHIAPADLLEELSGFYTKTIPLQKLGEGDWDGRLQELICRGYLVLLEGRENTDLNSCSQSNTYAILNHFEKGGVRKLLISCPNVVEKWKDGKERQLAILKAHFNKHNQSCVWVDQSKLDYYFRNAIVCFLKHNYLRNELRIRMKIKADSDHSLKSIDNATSLKENITSSKGNITCLKEYTKSIFFRFKIQTPREQPLLLQLVDLETKARYDLSSLEGWKNQGAEPLIFDNELPSTNELIRVNCEPGEYTCMFQIKEKQVQEKREIKQGELKEQKQSIIKMRKEQESERAGEEEKKRVKLLLGPEHLKELMLVNWAVDPIQVEYMQEQFGTIEWLSYFKTHSIANWSSIMRRNRKLSQEQPDQGEYFIYETVNNKTMLLIRKTGVKNAYLQLPSNCGHSLWNPQSSVLEGKVLVNEDETSIGMVREARNAAFFYMVASHLPMDVLKEEKMRFIYEYE